MAASSLPLQYTSYSSVAHSSKRRRSEACKVTHSIVSIDSLKRRRVVVVDDDDDDDTIIQRNS